MLAFGPRTYDQPLTIGDVVTGPVVGILGGMEPAATADFYAKLISRTPAAVDQQHLRVIIWSDPTVPDRSWALTGEGPDPTPWLRRGAHGLRAAGAGVLVMPCNTAHAFMAGIIGELDIPVVDMIAAVTAYVRSCLPDVGVVGLLATRGTIGAGLYQDRLGAAGVDVLVPEEDIQSAAVDSAIHAVKSGRCDAAVAERLLVAGEHLVRRGAQAVIAGCTEDPLGLATDGLRRPLVDSSLVLADAVLDYVAPRGP